MRALGLLALAACGGGGVDQPIELTHDACAPLALVSATPTDIQSTGIADAQKLWRDHGAPAVGLRADTTVEVKFSPAAPAFRGLYDDTTGVIYINDELTDPRSLSIVIAHELGHAFGLVHVTDHVSVMNPGNITTTPNDSDREALSALWGDCQ